MLSKNGLQLQKRRIVYENLVFLSYFEQLILIPYKSNVEQKPLSIYKESGHDPSFISM